MQPLHVVYHTAALGAAWCWKSLIAEQLGMLKECGLVAIRATHVGRGEAFLRAEAERLGLDLTVVRSDPNTDHFETFALAEVERLAKVEKTDLPILYLHTKGISAPHHLGKLKWRKFMEFHTIRQWRWNISTLADHDCVGADWIDTDWHHSRGHFCGNFWIANAEYLRCLPDFWEYHAACDRSRFSCESYIGSGPSVRPWSLVCRNHALWPDDFDWMTLGPWEFRCEMGYPPAPILLNLGCNRFYRAGWINVDLDRCHPADLYEDAALLPSIAPGTVDEIYAGHIAEHVEDVTQAFRRWWEILRVGGKITVVVPDGPGAVRLWAAGQTFPVLGAAPDAGMLGIATGYLSREASEADAALLQMHRRVFDSSALSACLQHAGFRGIRPVDNHPLMVCPSSSLGWQIALEGIK